MKGERKSFIGQEKQVRFVKEREGDRDGTMKREDMDVVGAIETPRGEHKKVLMMEDGDVSEMKGEAKRRCQ